MSVRWESPQLLQPITEDKPCGESLEDTELLASFDTFRLFGQSRPLDAPPEPDEKRIPKPVESPEWIQIRDKSLDALAKSKDLRLLAYLGTAVLRTDGLQAFAETLNVASKWLEMYWSQTYPLVDEDAILRRNALSCFADPMAIIDALRRTPLVRSRQHGTFSLRDLDIASNQLAPSEGDTPADEAQIHEAFASMPVADLTQLLESVVGAVASLNKIDTLMRESAGSDALPGFEPVAALLARMGQALRVQIGAHPDSAGMPAGGEEGGEAAEGGVSVPGSVKSRQDAIRALDAVALFFKRTEPSSPIPMFLERAKRLVSKDFLEVLADIAPDAVAQARHAGGLKDE
ncbi:MAG TPA: type VI secretion system protein TssA [Vicinamibacterales bacterium]|jgi:type VI secretion system protein ImpA|nr:type VI secretion system protein TssA [Vicinamibacterales bacterium]